MGYYHSCTARQNAFGNKITNKICLKIKKVILNGTAKVNKNLKTCVYVTNINLNMLPILTNFVRSQDKCLYLTLQKCEILNGILNKFMY